MSMGVPPQNLSDEDLMRELTHLKEKQDDIQAGGTVDQKANHATRTAELEGEFLRRNPADAPAGASSRRHAAAESVVAEYQGNAAHQGSVDDVVEPDFAQSHQRQSDQDASHQPGPQPGAMPGAGVGPSDES